MLGEELRSKKKKSSVESAKTRDEGNKVFKSRYHNKKVHLDILSLYNKSLAQAENDSEEMALAISNRSALLMHLNMHKEALIDIEKSCKITNSEDLKIKLLTRKMKCMSFVDKSDKVKKSNDKQKYKDPVIQKVSKTIPCAADCVTVTYDKDYGRCIIATEDIKPGTIIAKEEGFVLLPHSKKMYTNCSYCLMLAFNGIPCDSCTDVIYCSEKCKEEAWVQYHDVECIILSRLLFSNTEATEQMMMNLVLTFRMFIKFVKKEGLRNVLLAIKKVDTNNTKDGYIEGFFENGIFQTGKIKSFYNLSCDTDNNPTEFGHIICRPIMLLAIRILIEATDIFKDYKKFFNSLQEFMIYIEKVLYRLKRIVDQNVFVFQDRWETDRYDQIIGSMVATFCSFLNHNCDVYTGRGFTKNHEIFIYTLKHIKKGQQVFTNYGHGVLDTEKQERQDTLMKNYNFICKCEPCMENWPSLRETGDLSKYFTQADGRKLADKFVENDINKSAWEMFFQQQPVDKYSFDKTTLKDMIKIIQIIQKTFKGFQAFVYLDKPGEYIDEYFGRVSLKILNIPESC